MIEDVEEFRSKLQLVRFVHTEGLLQRHIKIGLAGTSENIADGIAEAGAVSDSRRCGEHGRVEIAVDPILRPSAQDCIRRRFAWSKLSEERTVYTVDCSGRRIDNAEWPSR